MALPQRLALSPYRAWLILFLALAFLLRVIGLGDADLGLDEAISHYIVDRSAIEIIRYCFVNVYEHPPTYYLLLRGWMKLAGESEFALRWLSAAFGLISTAAVGLLARRWFGRHVALFTVLLAAVWPMAVERGREARMYTLLPLAALLTVFAFDAALRRNRWRDWALFLGLFLFTLSIHYLAAFGIVGFAVLYALWWRRRPDLRLKWGVVLAILIGAPAIVIAAAPGPRESLISFLQLAWSNPWSPARLMPLYTGWVIGTLTDYAPLWLSVAVSTVVWLLFAFGLLRLPVADEVQRSRRLIVAVLVLVPAFVGSMLIFYVSSRHHSALSNLFVIGVALGLVQLSRRARPLALLTTAGLVAAALAVAVVRPMEIGRAFSAPLAHIEERALDGEPVIFSYYFDRYQRDYYSRRDLPPTYVGNMNFRTIPEEADQEMADMMASTPSAWLILRPDEYNPEVVEEALDRHAYPSQKVWFEGGRRVNHYFSAVAMRERSRQAVWDAGFQMKRWWSSGDTVAAGDALRLQFEWLPAGKVEAVGLVALKLAGTQNKVWAERLGGPCNDRCPTTGWTSEPVLDRQAFEIPTDLPPGEYELRLAWVDAGGAPWPVRPAADAVESVEVTLGKVTVTRATGAARPAPPLSRKVAAELAPGLTLETVEWQDREAPVGAALIVPLQWRVATPPAGLDAVLVLRREAAEHRIPQPIGPEWYPGDAWPAGATIRSQPTFVIPATLEPGDYAVAVAVARPGEPAALGEASIGRLAVVDRPRTFEIPDIGTPVTAGWAEEIRLVRVDAPARVAPGSTWDATLVWQAGGPATRNWKVFFHLVDAAGETRSQADAFPAGGAAPASGWRAGEVIADVHTFTLPPDLPAGEYRLHVGFYDEQTQERIEFAGGGDTFVLPQAVEVAP